MIRAPRSRAGEEALRCWAGRLLVQDRPSPEPPVADGRVIRAFGQRHGIGPMLAERLADDAPRRRPIQDDAEAGGSVAVELARIREFASVVNALQTRDGVRPVVFKGQALAYSLYPQPWLRPRGDIDALVDEAGFHAMTRVLRGLGYERANAIDGALVLRQTSLSKHQYGVDHTWDVHRSISNRPAFANVLTYPYLLETGIRVQAGDAAFTAPNRVNSLLIACLHLIGHHAHDIRLIWLYDIHLLAGSLPEPRRRDFLDAAMSRPDVRSACHAALALTHRYLPAGPTEDLCRSVDPGPGLRRRLGQRYLSRLIDDARTLVPRQRLAFVRQHLFPSPGYMTRRFGIRRRWQLPLWYVIRIGRAVPKLFRRR